LKKPQRKKSLTPATLSKQLVSKPHPDLFPLAKPGGISLCPTLTLQIACSEFPLKSISGAVRKSRSLSPSPDVFFPFPCPSSSPQPPRGLPVDRVRS